MAFKSGVFFSKNIAIQMEATAGFSFTFGSFPEIMVPWIPPTDHRERLLLQSQI
jgi:hypothetical protein